MAVIFDTIDEGVKQTTGLLSASQQYVTTTFWAYFPAWPTVGVTRTLYMVSNSAARDTESISIVQDNTGLIYLRVGITAYGGQVFNPGWHSIGLRRRVTLNFLDMDVDNDSAAVSTATVTFGSWTFNEMYLGTDPRAPNGGAPMQVQYFREWPAFISYTPEWNSPIPQRTSDIWTDTPFHKDLKDTISGHDWQQVGGGPLTYTVSQYRVEGAMGGWWRYSSLKAPTSYTTMPEGITIHHECVMKVEVSGHRVAVVQIGPGGYSHDSAGGGTYTAVHYRVYLHYGMPVSGQYDTAAVELIDPPGFPDPGNGASDATVDGRRDAWMMKLRITLVYKTSTWNPQTSTYASDGHASIWFNETKIIGVDNVVIPLRIESGEIVYTVAAWTDCDRIWARTVAEIPPTDSEGNFTGGMPSSLVYFDEFDNANFPGWTKKNMFIGGSSSYPQPNRYSNAGGNGTWGMSIYDGSPDVPEGGAGIPWAGLTRTMRFPPMELYTPPPPDIGGIYYVNPVKTEEHDSYYNDVEKKIPNPFIRSTYFGE